MSKELFLYNLNYTGYFYNNIFFIVTYIINIEYSTSKTSPYHYPPPPPTSPVHKG